VRSKCKKCGGSSICEHQKERSQCKECGGSSICEHQRRRSN
jgi:ribosomal protein S27AE